MKFDLSLKMLLYNSRLAEELNLDYTAVRLEDLPHEDTMKLIAQWIGIEFRGSMLRSTWGGLDWHGDRISGRKFPSSGWSDKRTNNAWDTRLGFFDKYVFNYILNDQLIHYRYVNNKINTLDAVFVGILILFPLKFERRLISPKYIYNIIKNRNKSLLKSFIMSPYTYILRIKLCYEYYIINLFGTKLMRNWIKLNENCDDVRANN